MTLDQILNRVRRAMALDGTAFEEIRDDSAFTIPAVVAVVVAVLLAGFGAYLWAGTVLDFTPEGWFVDTFILGSIFTILLFLAGVAVMYVMITQVYRQEAAPDAILRVIAFAHLPYALGFFVFVPEVGFAFGIISLMALFFYVTYAIRSAFPAVNATQAVIAVLLGFAVWAFIIPLISDAPDNNFVTGVFVYSLFD